MNTAIPSDSKNLKGGGLRRVCHVYNRAINSALILSADDEKNLFADLVRKKLTTLSLNIDNGCINFAIELLDIRVLLSSIFGYKRIRRG